MIATAINQPQLLYTAPTGKCATKNVRFCHTGMAAGTIWLWRFPSGGTAPTSAAQTGDELLSAFPISPKAIEETTGIWLNPGDRLYGMVSDLTISMVTHGPEEAIT
jgi:hypothetical protein